MLFLFISTAKDGFYYYSLLFSAWSFQGYALIEYKTFEEASSAITDSADATILDQV
jgi:hypothetical protein